MERIPDIGDFSRLTRFGHFFVGFCVGYDQPVEFDLEMGCSRDNLLHFRVDALQLFGVEGDIGHHSGEGRGEGAREGGD